MKKIIAFSVLMFIALGVYSQTTTGSEMVIVSQTSAISQAQTDTNPIDLLAQNWGVILVALMAFVKVIVNLTPSEKDNGIFTIIDKLVNMIVPNISKDTTKLHTWHLSDLFKKNQAKGDK